MNLLRPQYAADPSRIFLHFINRELHDSLGVIPDPAVALGAVRMATLFSDLPLSCNISQVYEFGYKDSAFVEEIIALSNAGIVELDCAFPSFDEFHESRRTYYRHDFKRYPMYSVDGSKTIFSQARIEGPSKVSSTTLGIQRRIEALSREGDRGVAAINPSERKMLIAKGREIRGALENRDGAGLTFALFPARGLQFNGSEEAMALRRALTASYVEHYQAELNAVVLTQYPHLGYYDRCSVLNSTCFNLECLRQIINFSRLDEHLKRGASYSLDSRIRVRHGPEQSLLAQRIMQLGGGLDSAFEANGKPSDHKKFWSRAAILNCQRYLSVLNIDCSLEDVMIQLAQNIDRVAGHLSTQLPAFEVGWKKYEAKNMVPILVMTATDTEDDVLFSVLKNEKIFEIGKRTPYENVYTEFAMDASRRLFHVRSSAGTVGSNSSLAVTLDAIRYINPKYIISVGICFGLDEGKQKLGDVTVSTAVKLYEPGKIKTTDDGSEFIGRGDRVTASAVLLDRARVVRRDWSGCAIHQGLVVSGEKLVNADDFRSWLKKFEPEAIAGEMEGAGIVSASIRHSREWIVVKGIADWGREKTDANQSEAAENAIVFSLKMIGLLPSSTI